jgi:hypothetical protein
MRKVVIKPMPAELLAMKQYIVFVRAESAGYKGIGIVATSYSWGSTSLTFKANGKFVGEFVLANIIGFILVPASELAPGIQVALEHSKIIKRDLHGLGRLQKGRGLLRIKGGNKIEA